MKAIMLAAGEGTRSYPFTYLYPKITQGVCGIPLIEYMLCWFGGAPEIERLYIVVKYDSTVDVLKRYIEKRDSYLNRIVNLFNVLGYRVDYINRDFEIVIIRANGWGTGGDLRFAIRQITSTDVFDEDFVVCNGDYVVIRKLKDNALSLQLNLSEVIEYHKNCKQSIDTAVTVALFPVERKEAKRFGVAQVKENSGFNTISSFMEKPDIINIPGKPLVNAGIYVMDSKFIFSKIDELLPDKPNTNLEKTLLEHLAAGNNSRLAAYMLDLYGWFDVGNLEQLINVNVNIASRKGGYGPPP